jgi:hypothetical protein
VVCTQALDAYPEAYLEFKRLMLALLLDNEGPQSSKNGRGSPGHESVEQEGTEQEWQREAREMMSAAARRELSEVVYHTAMHASCAGEQH